MEALMTTAAGESTSPPETKASGSAGRMDCLSQAFGPLGPFFIPFATCCENQFKGLDRGAQMPAKAVFVGSGRINQASSRRARKAPPRRAITVLALRDSGEASGQKTPSSPARPHNHAPSTALRRSLS